MQEKLFTDLEEFLQTFRCVGSFSQDRKEANSIIIPGQFMPGSGSDQEPLGSALTQLSWIGLHEVFCFLL
jgi:hypothetical protein